MRTVSVLLGSYFLLSLGGEFNIVGLIITFSRQICSFNRTNLLNVSVIGCNVEAILVVVDYKICQVINLNYVQNYCHIYYFVESHVEPHNGNSSFFSKILSLSRPISIQDGVFFVEFSNIYYLIKLL